MGKKIEAKIIESSPEPLKVALKALAEVRGISESKIIDHIKDILIETAKDILGDGDYDVEVDQDNFIIKRRKRVVEVVKNPNYEISLEEIKKIDPRAEPGDEVDEIIPFSAFGRRGAQKAKSLLTMQLTGAIEEAIFEEYSKKKGQLITGIVKEVEFNRFTRSKQVFVNLGRNIIGTLGPEDLLPQDMSKIKEGDSIKAIIKEVRKKKEGKFERTEIILSRTDPKFVEEILRKNVSEVEHGVVKIKKIVREPGMRSKILVYSNDPSIDPVGTCIGIKGIRIKNIMQELGGERIDIIAYTTDIQKLIMNSLGITKASGISIRKTQDFTEAIVFVPDDILAMAVGRKGVNVKLASELLDMKIIVRSETERERIKAMLPEFYKQFGLGEKQSQILWEHGFKTLEDIALAPLEKLKGIPGMTEEELTKLWQGARKLYFEKLKEISSREAKEEEKEEEKGAEAGQEQ